MQMQFLIRRGWRSLAIAGLLSVGSASYYMAQGRTAVVTPETPRVSHGHPSGSAVARRLAQNTPTRRLAALDLTVAPHLDEYPVVVLPAQRGFHALQAALDFCHTLPEAPIANVILLDAGTYTGNYTMPPSGSLAIIGREGGLATTIQGVPGINQPALRFAPVSGPATTELALVGLTIVGEMQAAVQFVGATSNTELGLENCHLITNGPLPAISMTGSGYGQDQRAVLNLWETDIDSAGKGISANVGNHVEIFTSMSMIGAADIAVDFQCGAVDDDTEVILFHGAAWGLQALSASNVNHLWSGGVFLSGGQTAVTLTNVSDARLEQAEVNTESGHAVEVSGTDLEMEYMRIGAGPSSYGAWAVSSSNVNIAFSNFSTDTDAYATYVDASSTETRAFNHWRFLPLP